MRLALVSSLLLLTACHGGDPAANRAADPIGANAKRPNNYTGVGPDETLRFTGTEPFWGGSVKGTALTYTTPEKPAGTTITVTRLAGNNGLAYSGTLDGATFDMAVTEAPCSDGMSDRSYPLTVSLKIGEESRAGCGWTDRRSFTNAGGGTP